jgi:hypothetical protein
MRKDTGTGGHEPSEEQRQQQITDIINELESLSLRTTILTCKLKLLRQQGGRNNQAKTTISRYDHDFKEGELVIITNGYRKKKGTEGKVTYITKTQVTLQDESGRFHTRKFTNVKRVRKEEL